VGGVFGLLEIRNKGGRKKCHLEGGTMDDASERARPRESCVKKRRDGKSRGGK